MNLFFKIGAAVGAVLVVAVAVWAPLAGRDGLLGDSSPGSSSTPVPNDGSSLGAADLPRIVVSATTVPARLSVSGTLSGPDALRASGLIPDDQSGFVDALLVTLTRASDEAPHAVGHTFEAPLAARFLELNGQYGSLAVVFETVDDAERAFEASAARLTAADGWGLELETDTSFSSGDWVPEGGVRYFQGRDYGGPILRAYLWRVDNVLLYGVDFHVYDLPTRSDRWSRRWMPGRAVWPAPGARGSRASPARVRWPRTGLEVADAEAARAVALDDLEEERRAVLDRAGEDLEEVALLVAVGLDAELLERCRSGRRRRRGTTARPAAA